MPDFESRKLDSGLWVHYLACPGPSTVALLRINVGKLDDPEGLEGMAHLIEHMIAGPTEPEQGFLGRYWMPEERILRWESASTGATNTRFHYLAEAGHEEALFVFLRDRAFRSSALRNLLYHAQCLGNELLHRGSDAAQLEGLDSLFEDHRLLTATSLPGIDGLMTFSLQQVRDHHRSWYRFGNADLLVASPRGWDEIEPLIARSFDAAEAEAGGESPIRAPAKPKVQSGVLNISMRDRGSAARLKMSAGLEPNLPPGLIALIGEMIRVRMIDALRPTSRISYGPRLVLDHYGVGSVMRIYAKAPVQMSPTLWDAMSGMFADLDWTSDYLEPIRDHLLAASALMPEPSVTERLKDTAAHISAHGRLVCRDEFRRFYENVSADRIRQFLDEVGKRGFYAELS